MKVTKQEVVMFSKGRCCFVRFECEGTSDRALLREADADELVAAWESRALTPKQAAAYEMYEALVEAQRIISYAREHLDLGFFEIGAGHVDAAIAKANGKQ